MIRVSRSFSARGLYAALAAATLVSTGIAHAQPVPRGDWLTAQYNGQFGPVVPWPLIPIHAVLLPDGRVMSYGTDGAGVQSALFQYEVWSPWLGTGSDAHLVLPNTTGTDIFCSAQTVLPSGAVLLTGGNHTTNWEANLAIDDVSFFDFLNQKLYSGPSKMAWPRWYPSVVVTASGEALVLGGRTNPLASSTTPEVYSANGGWRALPGANSEDAFGGDSAWIYPKAWQSRLGTVTVLGVDGDVFQLGTQGQGSLVRSSAKLPNGHPYLPSVMYAPGKILSLRESRKAVTVDIDAQVPSVRSTSSVDQLRYHGNATVLADGRVFVNGGSTKVNEAVGVAYTSRLWTPSSGSWSTGATARMMRLYHSISLLLPDGSVLTGGGGAPGPQTNLNAEIYYPPYLYKKDWSGKPAVRPLILSAPDYLTWGSSFDVRADSTISRMTLVRTGSVTHAHNFDQRFFELALRGSGAYRSAMVPTDGRTAPPGFYMLFVFNGAGVPSVARVVRVGD